MPIPRQYAVLGPLRSGSETRAFLGCEVVAGAPRRDLPVVVVWLPADVTSDPKRVARLQRETAFVTQLEHPNVIRVYGLECFEEGWARVVAYVNGEPLKRVLQKAKEGFRPIDPRLAAKLVVDLCDGVHFAHEEGQSRYAGRPIVHGGLRPDTVLLTFEGRMMVTGYGASVLAPATQGGGAVLEKYAYLAPEQIIGGKATASPATDIYALGALLYELLAGEPPYASAPDVERAVLTGDPPLFEGEGLAGRLGNVAATALAKRGQDRFESAEVMKEAILAALNDDGVELPNRAEVAAWVGELIPPDAPERRGRLELLEAARDPDAVTMLSRPDHAPEGVDPQLFAVARAASTAGSRRPRAPSVSRPPAPAQVFRDEPPTVDVERHPPIADEEPTPTPVVRAAKVRERDTVIEAPEAQAARAARISSPAASPVPQGMEEEEPTHGRSVRPPAPASPSITALSPELPPMPPPQPVAQPPLPPAQPMPSMPQAAPPGSAWGPPRSGPAQAPQPGQTPAQPGWVQGVPPGPPGAPPGWAPGSAPPGVHPQAAPPQAMYPGHPGMPPQPGAVPRSGPQPHPGAPHAGAPPPGMYPGAHPSMLPGAPAQWGAQPPRGPATNPAQVPGAPAQWGVQPPRGPATNPAQVPGAPAHWGAQPPRGPATNPAQMPGAPANWGTQPPSGPASNPGQMPGGAWSQRPAGPADPLLANVPVQGLPPPPPRKPRERAESQITQFNRSAGDSSRSVIFLVVAAAVALMVFIFAFPKAPPPGLSDTDERHALPKELVQAALQKESPKEPEEPEPEEAPPAEAAQAAAAGTDAPAEPPKERYGTLALSTTPSVEVFAGNQSLGRTPITAKLLAGKQRLRFTDKQTGINLYKTYRLRGGERLEDDISFGTSILDVKAPDGAAIQLNAKVIGKAPMEPVTIYEGEYLLRVTYQGMTWSERFEAPPGRKIEFKVNLEEKK